MKAPQIPGWKNVIQDEYDLIPHGETQTVDGETYVAEENGLQALVREWLEANMTIWLFDRINRIEGEFTALTRSGEDALDILVEWGWLDDKGQPTEKSGYGWVNKEQS